MRHLLNFILLPVLLAAPRAYPQTAALGVTAPPESSGDRVVLGGFIGSPSRAGVTGGLYLGPLVVRLSGASFGHSDDGWEGDIGIALTKNERLIQDLSLVAGFYHASTTTAASGTEHEMTQRFVGAAYGVYYAGFFLQGGIGKGTGDFPSPELIYRFGYLFSF